MRTVLLVSALLFPVTAAAVKPPDERVVALFDELGNHLQVANDCKAVAGSISAWTGQHGNEVGPLLLQVNRWVTGLVPHDRESFEARLAPSLESILNAQVRCAHHVESAEALEQLDLLVRGPSPTTIQPDGAS